MNSSNVQIVPIQAPNREGLIEVGADSPPSYKFKGSPTPYLDLDL